MSDAPPDGPKTAGRDALGRFGAGNPGGGRPALPEWFRAKGEDALRVLVDVMMGEREDAKVSPAQAAQVVAERVYGRVPQATEMGAEETGVVIAALYAAVTRDPTK